MKALQFERNLPRFAAARVAAGIAGSGHGVRVGPLELVEIDQLVLPGPGWVRLRPRLAGICGSDLATLDGQSSRYFEHIVSFPFVPGHEVVADVEGGRLDGRRVVLEPVLGCEARGIEPLCPGCASGHKNACERIAFGHLRPGLQTGYCRDTGGGWSSGLVAHESQLHEVPDDFSDEAAVMVEPAACAVHAACAAEISGGERVVVLGAGTLGLCVVAALRRLCLPGTLVAVAKHPGQRELARDLGADQVVKPGEDKRAARRLSGSLALESDNGSIERLTGGVEVVVDCVGSASSLTESLDIVRPGGRIILVGMPGTVRVDLAPLWQREVELRGAYAYGTEARPEGPVSSFQLAFELVREARLERLVSARYATRELRGRRRPCGCRRQARGGKDRLRPAKAGWQATCRRRGRKSAPGRGQKDHCEKGGKVSPRPGFVLEVDRSTPATLLWHGRASAWRSFPSGAGSSTGPSRCPALRDPDSAIRHALDHPSGTRSPCRSCCFPACGSRSRSTTSRSRSRRCARLTCASASSRPCSTSPPQAGVDDVVLIAALALHRRMTDDELRHALGDASSTRSPPTGCSSSTTPRTPTSIVHLGAHRGGRGRRDQHARAPRATCSSTSTSTSSRWTAGTSPSPPGSPATGASAPPQRRARCKHSRSLHGQAPLRAAHLELADGPADRRVGSEGLPDRDDAQHRHLPGPVRLPAKARVGVEPSRPGELLRASKPPSNARRPGWPEDLPLRQAPARPHLGAGRRGRGGARANARQTSTASSSSPSRARPTS